VPAVAPAAGPAVLEPSTTITPAQLRAGQTALVHDLAWASVCGALSGGVILTAFALGLGASPLQMGLLAAIPFAAQVAQWPATLLIERVRRRRLIGVMTISGGRLLIGLTALLPLLTDLRMALTLLLVAEVLIAVLHAVGACAVNSWLHQLTPPSQLGAFFARRLFWGTTVSCAATLAAGALVEHGPGGQRGNELGPFAWAFALAALAGFVSSAFLARAPEPLMRDAGPLTGLIDRLRTPLRAPNFRRLLVFLAAWTVASNLAVPFIAVYLIEQLGHTLGTVTQLWVASQVANALTLYLWGRLSDRLTNKGVLAVVLPLHFLGVLSLVFLDAVSDPQWQLGALYVIHVALGIAAGGIGLAMGNLGLKLAPPAQATAFLAAIGLVSAVTGGLAPVVAGALAQLAEARELSAVVRWTAPGKAGEWTVVSFAHWDALFVLSAALGLYVLHALSRVDEGREVGEREVVQEFLLEAWRSVNGLSSVAGNLGSLFAFERLTERRKWWRTRGKPSRSHG
jgi:MFS family permease